MNEPDRPAGATTTPLFPLTHPLFPGGRMALQIFEPRYLDMVGRAARDGTAFAVVRLTEGGEVQRPAAAAAPGGAPFAAETFADVGTLAHLDHVDRPQPGLLRIVVRGGARVRLVAPARRLPTGLWVGEVAPIADDLPTRVPPDLQPLTDALRAAGAFAPDDAGAGARFDDCGWLANRLAERLPLHPAQQQRLLEQPSPLLRLELVADHWRAWGRGRGAGPTS